MAWSSNSNFQWHRAHELQFFVAYREFSHVSLILLLKTEYIYQGFCCKSISMLLDARTKSSQFTSNNQIAALNLCNRKTKFL
jgi:hypothetical protein